MSAWTGRAAGAVRSVHVAADGCVRDCWRVARTNLSHAFDREPWWAEIGSGLSAVGCAVAAAVQTEPLEAHPIVGHLAQMVGGHTLVALALAGGVWQIVVLLVDSWPWRWIVALAMTGWWSIPALQVFKIGADAPMLAASCAGWAAVNVASAICLVRRGPGGNGARPGGT